MKFGLKCTLSSGKAARIPSRDSVTTSAGLLMSFFILRERTGGKGERAVRQSVLTFQWGARETLLPWLLKRGCRDCSPDHGNRQGEKPRIFFPSACEMRSRF